jgi:hypothetical protein
MIFEWKEVLGMIEARKLRVKFHLLVQIKVGAVFSFCTSLHLCTYTQRLLMVLDLLEITCTRTGRTNTQTTERPTFYSLAKLHPEIQSRSKLLAHPTFTTFRGLRTPKIEFFEQYAQSCPHPAVASPKGLPNVLQPVLRLQT